MVTKMSKYAHMPVQIRKYNQGGNAQIKVKFRVFPALSLCLQFFPVFLSAKYNTF